MNTESGGPQQPPPMWQGPPGSYGPPPGQGPGGYGYPTVQAHRGTAVLVLGILGIVACLICGIIAWVMGASDLQAMRDGRMDRSGESNTRAGMICGMISVGLHVVGFLLWILFFTAMFRAVEHVPFPQPN